MPQIAFFCPGQGHEQDKTRQDKTRQDKTRQGKARQDSSLIYTNWYFILTRYDTTRHDQGHCDERSQLSLPCLAATSSHVSLWVLLVLQPRGQPLLGNNLLWTNTPTPEPSHKTYASVTVGWLKLRSARPRRRKSSSAVYTSQFEGSFCTSGKGANA